MQHTLPASPASARRARRLVVDALHRSQWQAAVDVAELLVSELVANAVLHARTEIYLRVDADRTRVRVEVVDGSRAPVRLREFSEQATTGRGLALVEALAARWGSEVVADNGKSVWFELDGRQRV